MVGLGILGVGVGLWNSWRSVERVAFDPTAFDSPDINWTVPLADTSTTTTSTPDASTTSAAPDPPEGTQVFLVVGSDSRVGVDDTQIFGEVGGARADVVMLWIQPSDAEPAIVSIPRDLWIVDPCRGSETRINALLAGCADANGPSLLAAAAGRIAGVTVDHFALVDLAGFQAVVDRLGGYEICVDYAVRDRASGLSLDAGCTLADGSQTLAWLRSRKTQQLVDGRWRTMPGVSDLTRNARQQQFLVDMLGRLSDVRSPTSLLPLARDLSQIVVVDDGLDIGDALDLAWSLRGTDPASIIRISIPVADYVTEDGSQVLIPTGDVSRLISEHYSAEVLGTGPA